MAVGKHKFTVKWRGPFPMDMLRYDCAWPKFTEDANEVAKSLYINNPRQMFEATFLTDAPMSPTHDRWASFSAQVQE